jgi:hypothetical protein
LNDSGVCLVKPTGFDPLTVCGPDIGFETLVPMHVHKASSVYSQMKDDYMRRILAAVDEKDTELQLSHIC